MCETPACVISDMCVLGAYTWGSEDIFQEPVPSVSGYRDAAQAIRFVQQVLLLMSHLAGPVICINYCPGGFMAISLSQC